MSDTVFRTRDLPRLFHGCRLWVAPGQTPCAQGLPLTRPDAWCRFRTAQQVSESTITNAFRVESDHNGAALYFKRYVYRRAQWRYLLRSSRAVCEAAGLSAMRSAGVPSAELVAVGEWRRLGLLKAAFLVTREVPGTLDLREFAVHRLPELSPADVRRARRDLGTQVVDQVRTLHRAGLVHRDLKWRNILVRRDGNRWRCWFIDCPRFARRRRLRRRDRVLDISALARGAVLYLPAAARLRLLLRYTGRDRCEARRILRSVDAHLARRPPQHRPVVTKDLVARTAPDA